MDGLQPIESLGRGPVRPPVSRREALKRGAIVGGSLLWAAPVVQALAVSPATAQVVSPGAGPGPGGPGPGPGDTTTTTTQGTTTTTTQAPTTTTQAPTTTTTVRTEVLGTEVDPAPPVQVLANEQARSAPAPAPAVLGAELRRTGTEVADLALLGGATTALGAAAVAWSRRRRADDPSDVAADDPEPGTV